MGAAARLLGYAGVALADILANGVAVLIIAVVVTIAARIEREERYAEQTEDIGVVMTREFSTRLILNQLAASPPARLHDYVNSPLDEIFDPDLLPIIELHRDHVREYYTGTVWTRAQLLQRPNPMDAWLATFDEEKRARLRIDVYDVGQFYLTMSILRAHGIVSTHWHFLVGNLGVAAAGRCPPGVPASACAELEGGEREEVPELPGVAAAGRERPALGGADWPPPSATGRGAGGGGRGGAGPLPGGAVPDGGPGGGTAGRAGGGGGVDPSALGSFPRARAEADGQRGGLGEREDGGGGGAGGRRVRLRLALPENREEERGVPVDLGETAPEITENLGALMHFLGEAQRAYDAGRSPDAWVRQFRGRIRDLLREPPELSPERRRAVETLARRLALLLPLVRREPQGAPLDVGSAAAPEGTLVVEANVPVSGVGVGSGAAALGPGEGETAAARPALSLNAYPGIWRGLQVRIERGAAFLLPPGQVRPEETRWRAVAYVAPRLDDFIVGFVHAAVDPEGRLLIEPADNRAGLDGRRLGEDPGTAAFGSRGWLAAFYAVLAAGLLALLVFFRRTGRRAPA